LKPPSGSLDGMQLKAGFMGDWKSLFESS
jgi:hypothetical protein